MRSEPIVRQRTSPKQLLLGLVPNTFAHNVFSFRASITFQLAKHVLYHGAVLQSCPDSFPNVLLESPHTTDRVVCSGKTHRKISQSVDQG